MSRSYDELKKYIYINPNRLFDKRFDVNELNKDCTCREITLTWYGDSSRVQTCLIQYKWTANFASGELPDEKDFPNRLDYYREWERLSNNKINQFTDEELFLFAAKASGYNSYKKNGYNSIDRKYNASFELHKTCNPALLTIEVYKSDSIKQNTSDIVSKSSSQNNNGSSGCYITTAVCKSENKPDDCYELMIFRNFRDNWLKKQPDGENLIAEYYSTAPEILKCIDNSDNPEIIYTEIKERFLKPCLELIQQGKMQKCKDTYVSMVRMLQKNYLT